MRKLLSFLLIFNLAHATAPTGYKNETVATKTYAQDLVFPNNQLTKQAGLDSRIETGNTNLLTNPSFEHSTVTTGWTITNATATADTTNQVEGKKALSLALTGALSVVQDSTINAANLVGLQGVARIKIKTSDVDGLKVCARNAGVTSTSLCINIPKDGVWKEINIPYILTATSNGIAITSTGTTGTVKLDDGFVGTSAPFQGVSGAKLVGTLTYASATNCQWLTSSNSFADFAADTDCATPTVTGSLSARATKIPGFTINNALPGTYRIVASGLISRQTSGGQCAYRYYDGTNSSPVGQVGANATSVYLPNFEGHITLNTTQSTWNVSLQALSSTGTAGCYLELDTAALAEELTFAVYYFPPESKIYSQASQDYAYTNAGTIAIGATTTNPTKGTVVTDRIFASRDGQRLKAKYQYEQSSVGTAGSGDYLFDLPSGLSFDSSLISFVTTSSTSSAQTLGKAVVGEAKCGDNTGSLSSGFAVAYSSTKFRIFCSNIKWAGVGASVYMKSVGNTWYALDSTMSLSVEIDAPIQGWQDYGVIVGSFAGIETCSSPYECTDTFSAQISDTGIVSGENIDWISGNCSISTSRFTCTLKSGLLDGVANIAQPMNCVASGATTQGGPRFTSIFSSSTTQIQADTYNDAGNAVPYFWQVTCQKAGADYKPKTAKVATSIGVPVVPGITTTGTGNLIDTFSVSYGTTNATTVCSASPCSYLDQIGNVVSSVTRTAANNYSLNLSKTYAKLKCSASVYNGVNGGIIANFSNGGGCLNCNSMAFSTSTASTYYDTFGTLYCQGSY